MSMGAARGLLAACALILAAAGGNAAAQDYPSRPIRLVIPFAAGGMTDIVGRVLGQKYSDLLKQPVVIENKPGAASTIGTDFVAKSVPDGYTLAMISTTHVIGPWLYKNLPYDALKDFAPIAKLIDGPYVLVVNPKVPAKNVAELVSLAKAQPGKLDYASSGNGSTQHLTGALFGQLAGVQINHVPYKGSAQAMQDLIGGQVALEFVGIPGILPQLKAGRIRALAVTTAKRAPDLPEVPTMEEAGVKGYVATSWLGLVAPAKTPKNVLLILEQATNKALADPQARKTLAGAGVEVSTGSAAEFEQLLRSEYEKWGKVAAATGATVN
jgi:tripartite-type tricarboxylate transporter receptor subunit TctC